jgi:hypothetical protein
VLGGTVDPHTHETAREEDSGVYVQGTTRHSRDVGAFVRVVTCGVAAGVMPGSATPSWCGATCAARDYGVVVVGDLDDPERLAIDHEATTDLRSRGPRS